MLWTPSLCPRRHHGIYFSINCQIVVVHPSFLRCGALPAGGLGGVPRIFTLHFSLFDGRWTIVHRIKSPEPGPGTCLPGLDLGEPLTGDLFVALMLGVRVLPI